CSQTGGAKLKGAFSDERGRCSPTKRLGAGGDRSWSVDLLAAELLLRPLASRSAKAPFRLGKYRTPGAERHPGPLAHAGGVAPLPPSPWRQVRAPTCWECRGGESSRGPAGRPDETCAIEGALEEGHHRGGGRVRGRCWAQMKDASAGRAPTPYDTATWPRSLNRRRGGRWRHALADRAAGAGEQM